MIKFVKKIEKEINKIIKYNLPFLSVHYINSMNTILKNSAFKQINKTESSSNETIGFPNNIVNENINLSSNSCFRPCKNEIDFKKANVKVLMDNYTIETDNVMPLEGNNMYTNMFYDEFPFYDYGTTNSTFKPKECKIKVLESNSDIESNTSEKQKFQNFTVNQSLLSNKKNKKVQKGLLSRKRKHITDKGDGKFLYCLVIDSFHRIKENYTYNINCLFDKLEKKGIKNPVFSDGNFGGKKVSKAKINAYENKTLLDLYNREGCYNFGKLKNPDTIKIMIDTLQYYEKNYNYKYNKLKDLLNSKEFNLYFIKTEEKIIEGGYNSYTKITIEEKEEFNDTKKVISLVENMLHLLIRKGGFYEYLRLYKNTMVNEYLKKENIKSRYKLSKIAKDKNEK